jgi:hypothetical protein
MLVNLSDILPSLNFALVPVGIAIAGGRALPGHLLQLMEHTYPDEVAQARSRTLSAERGLRDDDPAATGARFRRELVRVLQANAMIAGGDLVLGPVGRA